MKRQQRTSRPTDRNGYRVGYEIDYGPSRREKRAWALWHRPDLTHETEEQARARISWYDEDSQRRVVAAQDRWQAFDEMDPLVRASLEIAELLGAEDPWAEMMDLGNYLGFYSDAGGRFLLEKPEAFPSSWRQHNRETLVRARAWASMLSSTGGL